MFTFETGRGHLSPCKGEDKREEVEHSYAPQDDTRFSIDHDSQDDWLASFEFLNEFEDNFCQLVHQYSEKLHPEVTEQDMRTVILDHLETEITQAPAPGSLKRLDHPAYWAWLISRAMDFSLELDIPKDATHAQDFTSEFDDA
jgi:hypothetical protein